MTEPSYTALARRFRPQTFDEVVGQQRIAQTIRRAIVEQRVAHAYLFTGARGVGKTSMARIFAKALNCPSAVAGVPCNRCETCRSIASGQDVDVVEIDGASNRGIDDIRTLRANVHVRSMNSPFKVYIIDEVHMLTREAFNALLKTLEEPPAHVKFIFCTTEPGKLPETILSRCQRFDFGTIASSNIVLRLTQIAKVEGFEVDEEALELVARRAAGSMRDSQSLFDQLLAFSSNHITAADVHQLFGTAPDERLIGLIEHLIQRNRAAALASLNESLEQGVQLESVADQMIYYVRDVLVCACGAAQIDLLGISQNRRNDVERQAAAWGVEAAAAALQILGETKSRMYRSTLARPLLELALVRLSLLGQMQSLTELMSALRSGDFPAASHGGSMPASAGAQTHSSQSAPTPLADDREKKNNSERDQLSSLAAGTHDESLQDESRSRRGDGDWRTPQRVDVVPASSTGIATLSRTPISATNSADSLAVRGSRSSDATVQESRDLHAGMYAETVRIDSEKPTNEASEISSQSEASAQEGTQQDVVTTFAGDCEQSAHQQRSDDEVENELSSDLLPTSPNTPQRQDLSALTWSNSKGSRLRPWTSVGTIGKSSVSRHNMCNFRTEFAGAFSKYLL